MFCVNFDAGSVLSKMFGIIWAGIQGKREAVYSLPSFLDYAKVSDSLPRFLEFVWTCNSNGNLVQNGRFFLRIV